MLADFLFFLFVFVHVNVCVCVCVCVCTCVCVCVCLRLCYLRFHCHIDTVFFVLYSQCELHYPRVVKIRKLAVVQFRGINKTKCAFDCLCFCH